MDIDQAQPRDNVEESDVPVYEPVYPEHEQTCAHLRCQADVTGPQRLCEDCIQILHPSTPNECPQCGETLRFDGFES
jgi:uncharacterized paraquat-inducible protein A